MISTVRALLEALDSAPRPVGPVGVMFHHGVMAPDDMRRASDVLARLATRENVVPRKMAELCP